MMSGWLDSLDHLIEEQATRAEEAKSRLEAAKALRALAIKHADLIIAFADTLRSTPPSVDERMVLMWTEHVAAYLARRAGPVELADIEKATDLSPAAVRLVLDSHPHLFESYPHPDRAGQRRWTVKRPSAARSRAITTSRTPPAAVGPTKAIVQWFTRHPEGGTASRIVNDLRNQIATTSDDPANVIYGVLSTMQRRGRVTVSDEKDGQKIYRPTPEILLSEDDS